MSTNDQIIQSNVVPPIYGTISIWLIWGPTPNLYLGKSPHTLPVTIQKTGQAVVIGLGEKDAVAGQVSKAVGKIADYIESVGY